MKTFFQFLLEDRKPNVDKAIDILTGHISEDPVKKALSISSMDPYEDKRFTPIIASWLVKKYIENSYFEEHKQDIANYRKLLKDLESKKTELIKKLNETTNETEKNFVKARLTRISEQITFGKKIPELSDELIAKNLPGQTHKSVFEQWILDATDIIKADDRDLSPGHLKQVYTNTDSEGNTYIIYEMNDVEDCDVPLIKNGFSYCITRKTFFGKYGGAPYYPVVKIGNDGIPKQYAMIIPSYIKTDITQAVRNTTNTDILSLGEIKPIEEFLKNYLAKGSKFKKFLSAKDYPTEKMIEQTAQKGTGEIYRLLSLYKHLSPELYSELEKDLMSRWEKFQPFYKQKEKERNEKQRLISKQKAIDKINRGELVNNVSYYLPARDYLLSLPREQTERIENQFIKNIESAYKYASEILKKSWREYGRPEVENVFRNPKKLKTDRFSTMYTMSYAKFVLKQPWGEDIIEDNFFMSAQDLVYYAIEVLKQRWDTYKNGKYMKYHDFLEETLLNKSNQNNYENNLVQQYNGLK